MRRLILALLLLLPLLAVPCSGAEVPSFPQVDELLEEAEGYGVEGTDGLEAGARSILSAAGAQLDGLIRRSLRLGLKLMAVVLLCGLAEGACLEGRSGGLQAVEMAGALAVTALTVSDMTVMVGLGRETIAKMDDFSGLLLPSPRPPEGSPARRCGRGPLCCAPACSSGGSTACWSPCCTRTSRPAAPTPLWAATA